MGEKRTISEMHVEQVLENKTFTMPKEWIM